ncbi:MAG: hypothetical protein GIX03_00230 [Candidatus Eremiobacteraeota bacterium]|nr:hypothetical protein [Candidatus Eremiobacteraeota bacterium]MBC5801449.1 hypothetical protein [Candidatus Eremiobacteraeota bacterium]MBC5821282.1 hypothetical protein [Candidatus Eremiobacteraeota bacterium]
MTKADRAAAVDRIAHAIVEDGETRLTALATIAGVHRNYVAPLLKSARERIGRECPPPSELRQTYLAQAATIYRKALQGHDSATARNDHRVANEFLKTANDSLRTAATIGGVGELKSEGGSQHPRVRIVFEAFEETAPPAALAAVARLSTAPGAAALSRSPGALPDHRSGREVREGHRVSDGAPASGNDGSSGA